MRAADFQVGGGVHRHLDLVVAAGDKFGEGGAERDFSRCGKPRADAEHVLLSDLALDKAVAQFLVVVEPLGERRIAHIRVEREDIGIRVAERAQRQAVCLAGGELA